MALVVTLLLAVPVDRGGAAPSRHQAGTEPGHYDGKGADHNGEQDFLASLDSAQKPNEPADESPAYVTLIRFILSLALVLGLAYVTILGLKRFTGLRTAAGGGRIRVLENAPLGANRSLHLVEIGQRRLVVGSTANQVNLIAEIGPDDIPDTEANEPPSFKEHLAGFLGSKPDSGTSAGNVARMLRDSTAFVQDRIGHVGAIRRRLRDAR